MKRLSTCYHKAIISLAVFKCHILPSLFSGSTIGRNAVSTGSSAVTWRHPGKVLKFCVKTFLSLKRCIELLGFIVQNSSILFDLHRLAKNRMQIKLFSFEHKALWSNLHQ